MIKAFTLSLLIRKCHSTMNQRLWSCKRGNRKQFSYPTRIETNNPFVLKVHVVNCQFPLNMDEPSKLLKWNGNSTVSAIWSSKIAILLRLAYNRINLCVHFQQSSNIYIYNILIYQIMRRFTKTYSIGPLTSDVGDN